MRCGLFASGSGEGEIIMRTKKIIILSVMLALALLSPLRALQAADEMETLTKYLAELKKKPDAQDLRAKIIVHVQSMKTAPPIPDDAMRSLTRGKAILGMAANKEGFEKAIPDLMEATVNAPWVADAYETLALAQEKAGLYADAIQSLNIYLIIAPRAKNMSDIKKKIYELEVYAEQAHQEVPAPIKMPKTAKKPEQGQQHTQMPGKKVNIDAFVGSWYGTQEGRKGEEAQIHVFTIRKNTKGDMIATPPRRVTGSIGSITSFEVSGANLQLQITWKSASIPNYWKTEDFDLTLSDDGSKLSGSYEMKSSGARGDFSDKREYTKQ